MTQTRNFIETAVTGTTPIRAALRKQSQPTTVNLTFHDTGKFQKEYNSFLTPSYQENEALPATDRKKEWRPLIPENELIANQTNYTVTAVPLDISLQNPNARHITPPPEQRNVHSRTINHAQNVQSMGRFENVGQADNQLKIAQLESHLEKLLQITSSLQKEKELALKFNYLLLRKLESAGVSNPERVLQVN